MQFRASELIIKEYNGVEYLNIRKSGDPSLIEEARKEGVLDVGQIENIVEQVNEEMSNDD